MFFIFQVIIVCSLTILYSRIIDLISITFSRTFHPDFTKSILYDYTVIHKFITWHTKTFTMVVTDRLTFTRRSYGWASLLQCMRRRSFVVVMWCNQCVRFLLTHLILSLNSLLCMSPFTNLPFPKFLNPCMMYRFSIRKDVYNLFSFRIPIV